jgi:hypothetical protein
MRTTIAAICWVLALVCEPRMAQAQTADLPRLQTNQAYVEEATRATALVASDPMAMFAYVLKGLPERVKVYPTENYYYFKLTLNGTPYAGNIRLDPAGREQGKVQFSYYPELSEWKGEMAGDVFVVLDAARGVKVEPQGRLVYRISYADSSVVFELNDLSNVRPLASILGADEKYLGPIFDESAIAFFLIYNSKLRIFHYVLDETARVADDFVPVKSAGRILIGRRTGFAFYRDHQLDRKILIGAFAANSRLNNYFDGPFDQLPENFIEGDTLWQAIIASDPSAKGQIDRLGNFTDGEGRYLIHPYMLYAKEGDLQRVHQCASGRVRTGNYYRCFVTDPEGPNGVSGQSRTKR